MKDTKADQYNMIARNLWSNGQCEDALSVLDGAIAELGDASLFKCKQTLCTQNQLWPLVIKNAKRWLRRHPKTQKAYLGKAKAEKKLGKLNAALYTSQALLAIEPTCLPARLLIAEIHLDRRDYNAFDQMADGLIQDPAISDTGMHKDITYLRAKAAFQRSQRDLAGDILREYLKTRYDTDMAALCIGLVGTRHPIVDEFRARLLPAQMADLIKKSGRYKSDAQLFPDDLSYSVPISRIYSEQHISVVNVARPVSHYIPARDGGPTG